MTPLPDPAMVRWFGGMLWTICILLFILLLGYSRYERAKAYFEVETNYLHYQLEASQEANRFCYGFAIRDKSQGF